MLTIALGVVAGMVVLCLIPPLVCGLFCGILKFADRNSTPEERIRSKYHPREFSKEQIESRKWLGRA